jgi:hypothetical protein
MMGIIKRGVLFFCEKNKIKSKVWGRKERREK